MDFKQKIVTYLKDHGVTVERTEQTGEVCSIVCHIPKSDNLRVEGLKDTMEKELDVAIAMSDMYGMNVVIVEANDLEEMTS